MGEKYVKDGKLYEKQVFGEDREIGEVKSSLTGEYVDTKTLGEGPYDVDRNPFTGETKVTTRRDYFSNTEEGFTIKQNPFKPHGQESKNWQDKIWPSYDAEEEENSASSSGISGNRSRDPDRGGSVVFNTPSSTQGSLRPMSPAILIGIGVIAGIGILIAVVAKIGIMNILELVAMIVLGLFVIGLVLGALFAFIPVFIGIFGFYLMSEGYAALGLVVVLIAFGVGAAMYQ